MVFYVSDMFSCSVWKADGLKDDSRPNFALLSPCKLKGEMSEMYKSIFMPDLGPSHYIRLRLRQKSHIRAATRLRGRRERDTIKGDRFSSKHRSYSEWKVTANGMLFDINFAI